MPRRPAARAGCLLGAFIGMLEGKDSALTAIHRSRHAFTCRDELWKNLQPCVPSRKGV